MKLNRKKIFFALGGIFLVMQIFRIDKNNPIADPKLDFFQVETASKTNMQRLKSACYDCHSNETSYPWYTNVAPVSWWVKGHINNGRKHLNFSTWGSYAKDKRDHKVEESLEMLEKRWMPLPTYVWLHPEAKMTKEENEDLMTFFKSLK